MSDSELLRLGAAELRRAASCFATILRLRGDEDGQLAAVIRSETSAAEALDAMAARLSKATKAAK